MRRDRGFRWRTGVAVIAAVSVFSCGSSAPDQPDSGQVATNGIGPQGGTATSSDGRVTLRVPAGALGAATAISILPIASPPPGAVGASVDIEPTGTEFAQPATLTFAYEESLLGGKAASALVVLTFTGGAWTPVVSTVDTAAGTVSAAIMHLSPWSYGFYSVTTCSEPADPTCGAGCSVMCSGAKPYPLCTPAMTAGGLGIPSTCTTPASCTCAANSSCSEPADPVCGAGCSVTCSGSTPHATCTPPMSSAVHNGGSTCTAPATCVCGT